MASKSAALLLSLNILFFTVLIITSIPSSEAAGRGGPGYYNNNNCPGDALNKLNVCADVLSAVVLKLPAPQNECCSLIGNLVKLDAAVCLCTSLRLKVLNVINLNVPIDLSLLLNYCKVPNGFNCA